jgi:hypothetical protein
MFPPELTLVDTARLAAMGGSQGGGGDAHCLCSQSKEKTEKSWLCARHSQLFRFIFLEYLSI